MATDIMDSKLAAASNARWEREFSTNNDGETQQPGMERTQTIVANRKATLVIEHIMKTSEVAHTMQDSETFLRWNECRFAEMYKAWREGRASRDPSETFYDSQLGFFDFFICPLAEKMQACGVLRSTTVADLVRHAKINRAKWDAQGRNLVRDYQKKYSRIYLPGGRRRSATSTTLDSSAGDQS